MFCLRFLQSTFCNVKYSERCERKVETRLNGKMCNSLHMNERDSKRHIMFENDRDVATVACWFNTYESLAMIGCWFNTYEPLATIGCWFNTYEPLATIDCWFNIYEPLATIGCWFNTCKPLATIGCFTQLLGLLLTCFLDRSRLSPSLIGDGH